MGRKNIMHLLFFLFSSAIVGSGANAQLPQYQLSRITEQEGLSTGEVIGMARDNNGYLWIATQGKLQSFDGKHTHTYTFNETIFHLFIDNHNRVWITTTLHVYMLLPGKSVFEKVGLPDDEKELPLRIFARANGSIGLLSNKRLLNFHEEQAHFNPDLAFSHINRSQFLRPFTSNENFVYITNAQSISRYNFQSKVKQSFPIKAIHSLSAIGQEGIIISSYLFKSFWLDNKQEVLLPISTASDMVGKYLLIHHAVHFAGNQYLLSSNKGLLLFNTLTKQCTKPVFYYNGKPLADPVSAKFLYRSKDGTVFICHADGIFFVEPQRQTIQYILNYSDGRAHLPDNDVRSFTEDETGNIWMATTSGIVRLNPLSGKIKTYGTIDKPNPISFQAYRYI